MPPRRRNAGGPVAKPARAAPRDRQPPLLPVGRREGRLDAMTGFDTPAQPDHVTGLATRGTLEAFLARPTATGPHLAVVICDVVGLKQVNEQENFLAGDAVLRAAAERLRRAGEGAELLARLGGDEMVAVFTGPQAAARAEATVRRLAEEGAESSGARAHAKPGAGEAAGPRLRAGMIVATPAETRESLVNRLYATVRRS